MIKNKVSIAAYALLTLSIGICICSFLLLKRDSNFNQLNSIFTLFSTLASAIIGGYIAFYASYVQIRANKMNETLRLKKLNLAQSLLTIHEIEYIVKLLRKCIEYQVSYGDLKKHLSFYAIEKFKNEFILLLDEANIKKFLSIYYKLSLVKVADDNHVVTSATLSALIEECDNMREVITAFHQELSSKPELFEEIW